MTKAERAHVDRIRSLPCCRCGAKDVAYGWIGPGIEAHHCGRPPRVAWATIPLCPACHRGKTGSGHAPGLGREELNLLKQVLATMSIDYAACVKAELRQAWARRLETRSGARYRDCLE